MAIKSIYQTLEIRGRINDLAKNGPYICSWDNSWLGDGFYFWDTFIDNAHWWGKTRKFESGYIICNAKIDYNEIDCCDLVGNTEHMFMFSDTYTLMKKKGLITTDTTVKKLIIYLKFTLKIFNFEGIRVYCPTSKKFNSEYSLNLFFEHNRPWFIDFKPAIQICLYSKNSLNLRDYKIVFPDEYIEGYLV